MALTPKLDTAYRNRIGQRVRVVSLQTGDRLHPVSVEWMQGAMCGRTYWVCADGLYFGPGQPDRLDLVEELT